MYNCNPELRIKFIYICKNSKARSVFGSAIKLCKTKYMCMHGFSVSAECIHMFQICGKREKKCNGNENLILNYWKV